jgi:hypothetical protein
MNLINLWFAEVHDTNILTIMKQKLCQLQKQASGIYVISLPDDGMTVYPTETTPDMLIPASATLSGI